MPSCVLRIVVAGLSLLGMSPGSVVWIKKGKGPYFSKWDPIQILFSTKPWQAWNSSKTTEHWSSPLLVVFLIALQRKRGIDRGLVSFAGHDLMKPTDSEAKEGIGDIFIAFSSTSSCGQMWCLLWSSYTQQPKQWNYYLVYRVPRPPRELSDGRRLQYISRHWNINQVSCLLHLYVQKVLQLVRAVSHENNVHNAKQCRHLSSVGDAFLHAP